MADINPESLEQLPRVKIDSTIREFVNKLSQQVAEEKTNRAWWDKNIDVYRNLRYGIRQPKNHPWAKCANYVIPLIDADISRAKPNYVNLINVTPIVTFVSYKGENIEASRKREQLFDWRRRKDTDFFRNYCLGVDYMLEQGMVVFKQSWKYATRTYTRYISLNELDDLTLRALYDAVVTDEVLSQIIIEEFLIDVSFEENQVEVDRVVREFREGNNEFELTLVETSINKADMTPCSVRDDLVFPVNTTDLNMAGFIDYTFPSTVNDIKIAMRDEKYEEYKEEEIRSWMKGNNGDNNRAYSTTSYDDDTVWLRETCCWYDVNDDGIKERCIVTWADSDPDAVLRFIELPFNHGEFPYVLIKREINDSGIFSSRGIPALDEDFQNGISTAFNQAVDNGTIVNSPKIVYKRNSVVNIRNIRYIPGEPVEVNGSTTDYEIRQQGNVSQQFLFGQAQYLKAWKDERLGNSTAGLSQINNQIGLGIGGSKTAKEVNVVEAMQAETQSLDLQIFQQQMAQVYYQLDALEEQFGDEEEELITDEKATKISRQEIQGKFNIIPNGRLDNSNPALRAQKSLTLLRAFLGDPDIRQRELKKLFLMDFDSKLVSKLFKTEEEIAQEQSNAIQAQEMAKQNSVKEQVGLRKISDNMDIEKEAILSTFQGKKYAAG